MSSDMPDITSSTKLVEQLRGLAGVDGRVDKFAVQRMGCVISVIADRGSVTLSTPVPNPDRDGPGVYRARGGGVASVRARRPLEIGLRHETAQDRDNKEAGINREMCTEDADFDHQVYINTDCEQSVVRAVLADERARAAGLLLAREEPEQIVIDDRQGNISVICLGNEKPSDPMRAERLIEAMASLSNAMPCLISSGARPIRWVWSRAIALLVLVCLPGAVSSAVLSYEPCAGDGANGAISGADACGGPILLGCFWGIGVAAVGCFTVWRMIRGEHNSSAKQRLWMIAVILISLELGITLTRVLWWDS
jgi:hypothetical protein